MDNDLDDQLESIANIASVANAVASLVVGHRKILVEGGFDLNLADSMCADLHGHLLGLVHSFDMEDDFELIAYPNEDDDE